MREFISFEPGAARTLLDAAVPPPFPTVTIEESEREIDLSFAFDGFIRADRPLDIDGRTLEFNTAEIPGTGYVIESGKPLLPSFRRYVQIPPGTDFKLNVTTPGLPIEIKNVNLAPAQEHFTDGPEKTKVEFDRNFYGRDELYPKEIVHATGPYFIDGYNSILLEVRPLQYNPKKKILIAHPRVNVTLALTAHRDTAPPTDDDPATSRHVFGNLMLNPKRIASKIKAPHGPELLIVYAARFGDAARRLAHWKNQRGVRTELVLFDPGMTAAKLKEMIRVRRGDLASRLRYVLLFGDVSDIPTENSKLGNFTDYYYSTAEDRTAKPYPFPWLSIGRIPARDTVEALAAVDQIIGYEKNPPADAAYYRRYVCAAYFQGIGHEERGYMLTMERIYSFLAAIGYKPERVYVSDDPNPSTFLDGSPVPDPVKAAFLTPSTATKRLVDATTNGQLIVAHRDHGDTDGWSNPPFTVADLNGVTGNMPSIFYSLNCLTGAWQANASQPECFAEVVLNKPGTAPTLIAATNVSDTFLNNSMMLALFDAMYSGLLPTFPAGTVSYPLRCNRVGDMLNYSRSYLLSKDGANDRVLSHFEKYHVVGDPTLEVWGNVPQPLSVDVKLTSGALTIQLSTLPPDCTVTLWHDDKLLLRKEPEMARFTLPLPALPRGAKITIGAWAPGFHYAEAKIALPRPVPVTV